MTGKDEITHLRESMTRGPTETLIELQLGLVKKRIMFNLNYMKCLHSALNWTVELENIFE